MSISPDDASRQLRAARPTDAATLVDDRAIADLETILSRPSPRRSHTPVRIGIGSLVAATAICAGFIAWPGTDERPGPSPTPVQAAFEVSRTSDGTVHLNMFATASSIADPEAMQAQLKRAGVHAVVVLAASAYGTCTSKLVSPLSVPDSVVSLAQSTGAFPMDMEYLIHADRIPIGRTLLFITPGDSGFPDVLGYTLIKGTPPTCFSYPDSPHGPSSQSAPSPAAS